MSGAINQVLMAVVDGFTYDPGHSDLDDEQPINVRMTLGDWRTAQTLAIQSASPEATTPAPVVVPDPPIDILEVLRKSLQVRRPKFSKVAQ